MSVTIYFSWGNLFLGILFWCLSIFFICTDSFMDIHKVRDFYYLEESFGDESVSLKVQVNFYIYWY